MSSSSPNLSDIRALLSDALASNDAAILAEWTEDLLAALDEARWETKILALMEQSA